MKIISFDNQITIADLTGVAVQDIQVAKAVYQQFPPDAVHGVDRVQP